MTTIENFYEQDLKKYEISKNKELLTWLKNAIKNGYHSFIDIEELQNLIDSIAYWYEMKYPEYEMEFYKEKQHINFENMEFLSKLMDIEQLMYRLPFKQARLLECSYRSNISSIRNICNDTGEITKHKTIVFMSITRKDLEYTYGSETSDFLLCADCDSGKVYIDYNLKDYINDESITLEQLLVLFKEKYSDEFDLTNLEECVFDHNCDIELRKRILQLVALKLLYSHRTIPKIGYERAKKFINEFNKKMKWKLSTEEIDEAINKYYSNKERWKLILKTCSDKNGNERSYWTVENVTKKEQKTLKKAKELMKSFLKK